ncbi:hypothetical protein LCGC14_2215500, partial [marine sediment metagenome]
MPRPFLDVATESALLDEVTQRRRRLSAQRRAVLPQTALLAESYADAYPWMDASAIQSLVQAGVAPDEPQVQQVATLAAQQAAADGDFDVAADDVPDSWLESLGDAVKSFVAPVTRTGFTILMSPIEEVQALLSSAGTALFDETEAGQIGLLSDPFGNLASILGDVVDVPNLISDFWSNYTEKAARSHGLIALSNLIEGKGTGLGEGFLPGGAVFEEREAAKHRLQIDGQFVTHGRLIARQFTEPGTFQWQMLSGINDFAQNLVLDPVILPLAKLSKAQKATKAFQTTGVVDGLRKTVAPERAVNHYLTSDLGRKTVRWFTQNTDVEAAWRATGKVDGTVARRLAATTNDTETFGVLTDVLGTVVREKPTAGFVSRKIGGVGGNDFGRLFGGGARVKRSIDNSQIARLGRLGRLGDDMPQRIVSIHDPNDALRQLDLWMRNAALPRDVRAAHIAELAALEASDPVGWMSGVTRIMDDTNGFLQKTWGLSETRAKKMTSLWVNMSDDLRAFDFDDLGRHVDVVAPLRVVAGGTTVHVRPMPGMISELIDDIIPLPDARAIRRATPLAEKYGKFHDWGLWKGSIDGLDTLMSNVWKPFQLLRLAYPVRVIGEDQ